MEHILQFLVGCVILAVIVCIGLTVFQFGLTALMLVLAGIGALCQWLWGLVAKR